MNLAFIGTGYVGLVSGVMMSHLGHKVTCIDVDQQKIDLLKLNKSPIYEPGIEEYIAKYTQTDKLKFACGYSKEELAKQDAVFITVGTPSKKNGNADLSYVYKSLDKILKYVTDECIIVIKSTVPPGSTNQIQEYIRQKGKINHVATNPEFLKEGSAVYDFLNPDRIVIGSKSSRALEYMREIYKVMTDQGIELVSTDFTTSELIKYASNAFLANKIAFINEMADLCEGIGANINDLSTAVGLDKRIGSAFLKAGPGFGGSCFPKDILALQYVTKKIDKRSFILDAIIKSNKERPKSIFAKIQNIIGNFEGKQIAILGLTYKAGTDDLRNSPAVELMLQLKKAGANIKAFDPMGNKNAEKYLSKNELKESAIDACINSDLIICLTEWSEFNELDYKLIASSLNQPILIDLRNFLDKDKIIKAGIDYYAVGINLSGK